MDDLLHDLVGATVDALDARIDERLRDRVFHHVAVAAVELDTGVDDTALQLGRPQLGFRRVDRRERALVVLADAAVDIGA